MKSRLPIYGLLVGQLLFSCQKAENRNETPSAEIVRDTVNSKEGTQLIMIFNNTQGTATFILNNETINLKQDTTASGIKFSNLEYEFIEHHGEITLKKNGQTIFSHKESATYMK